MTRKVRVLLAALIAGACLIITAAAWATITLTIHASFTPDKLGAPTNLSGTAKFTSDTGGTPPPISNFTVYAPAGMGVDIRGTGTCTAAKLEANGPTGCPADSRAGFGNGMALLELAKQVIHEPYTIDLFFAPKENGHLVFLAYVDAVSPASVELVLVAKEVHAPKPYGFGLSVEVPPIPTLPEASDASVEGVSITLGATNIAYYKTVHGKKRLFHVRGIVVPKTCPPGGFPLETILQFADGTSNISKTAIACPRK
jgi:hypothetical protein